MKLIRNPRALLLAGTSLLSMSAGTAFAEEMMVTGTETVKYYRTVATTPAGAVKLYGELHAAASRACRSRGMPMATSSSVRHECMSGALARAVADVNIDVVTALLMQDSRFAPAAGVVTVARR
jgi:UrcA family protein